MKPIPLTPQTSEAARRIVWFEEPERSLADPIRFLAYAMTYARHEDMRVIRQYVSDDEFRQALERAPPGIIDPRSWAYWNLKMGRFPPPPLPKRTFGDGGAVSPALKNSPEERRRAAAEAWRKIREQGATDDPGEVRRRASEEWFKEYGSGNKK